MMQDYRLEKDFRPMRGDGLGIVSESNLGERNCRLHGKDPRSLRFERGPSYKHNMKMRHLGRQSESI